MTKQRKRLCFSCLTEELSGAGAVSTFNLKQRPVQAPCAICDILASGHNLFPAPWGFICRDCCDYCETQTGISWELVKIAAQREWLVKVNNRITGPLTSEEVVTRLLDNRIVPLDEVMRPLGRWHLMRDEELFRGVLNEIKNTGHLKEKSLETTSSGVFETGGQQTSTMDTITDASLFTLPPKMPEIKIRLPDIQKTLPDELNPKSNPKTEKPITFSDLSRDLIRSYAFQEDPKIKREIEQYSRKKMWITLGIFIFVGLFAAFKLTQPKEGTSLAKTRSFEEMMEAGLKSEKVGDYQKALSYYSEARTFKPNDSEMLLHLAPLTLLYDRQILQAQRMFKEILATEHGANYQKAANLGLGLIALDSHELENAQEFFIKAITLDPDYIPAIANLGVVAYYKGEFDLANSYLLKALSRGGPEGALIITLAELNLAEADNVTGKRKLSITHATLDTYLGLARDYEQEVMLEDARVLSVMGKTAEAAKRIENMLDIDPEKSELHIRDWGIYRGRASWGVLLETLKKTSVELPSTPRLTAALGLAMYRGREKLDGAQSIEQALTQSPRDPLLMALAGWVEIKLGRREMGVVNIKEASLMPDKLKLPHILQARLCQDDKDFECARRHWKIVHDFDQKSVEALCGLALVEWNRRNVEAATSWLRQGQAMDPTYTPLLALSQEMQSYHP